ncbi:hypothetical protein HII31_13028 [Pseudocercospora fuligena]|uniref:Uncharacterized protein n=1 Tax=Pseudocercospora fuligena TaxID=685502 RepID=A0A8H6R6V3_9PEZI|nr:hypothetical protein HII31_13028 [Pseudocercospora fuligena]
MRRYGIFVRAQYRDGLLESGLLHEELFKFPARCPDPTLLLEQFELCFDSISASISRSTYYDLIQPDRIVQWAKLIRTVSWSTVFERDLAENRPCTSTELV